MANTQGCIRTDRYQRKDNSIPNRSIDVAPSANFLSRRHDSGIVLEAGHGPIQFLAARSNGGQTAVDYELGSGDKRGIIRDEKNCSPCDLVG